MTTARIRWHTNPTDAMLSAFLQLARINPIRNPILGLLNIVAVDSFTEAEAELIAPDAAFEESTAAAVKVLSSSADDTNASDKHARSILLVGIAANGSITAETVLLNGTTAVVSSTEWLRLMYAHVNAWGSAGSDAAGNITVVNNIETPDATYLTIAAGTNCSNGARIYVPAGYTIQNLQSKVLKATNTAATSGGMVKHTFATFDEGDGADPDLTLELQVVNDNVPLSVETFKRTWSVASGAIGKVTVSQNWLGGTETFAYDSWWVIYKSTPIGV